MAERSGEASGPSRDLVTAVEDLVIYEARYPRNSVPSGYVQPVARVGFVLEGSLRDAGREHLFLLEEDAFSYHPAHIEHSENAGPAGARLLVVEVAQHGIFDVMPSSVDLGLPLMVRLPQLRPVALRVARELRASDSARGTAIEGLALDLVARAARLIGNQAPAGRRKTGAPSWLPEARRIVEANLGHADLLSLICTQLRLQPRQVTRAFQQHAGAPFKSYVYGRLLTRALELLRDTEMPISEIASVAGFYDPAHLGHAVKRYVGMTPTTYRARHRR